MMVKGESINFQDTTQRAFGVEAYNRETNKDYMDEVITKYSPYPIRRAREYVTHMDD